MGEKVLKKREKKGGRNGAIILAEKERRDEIPKWRDQQSGERRPKEGERNKTTASRSPSEPHSGDNGLCRACVWLMLRGHTTCGLLHGMFVS